MKFASLSLLQCNFFAPNFDFQCVRLEDTRALLREYQATQAEIDKRRHTALLRKTHEEIHEGQLVFNFFFFVPTLIFDCF